jgi:hypothetical protein
MFRKILTLAVGAIAISAIPAQAGPRQSPEQELQEELRGRVAGEPVDCVNLRNVRNTRIIDGTAIVFDAGGTIYVNRPRGGANSLKSWDTQVVRPFGSRLCSVDPVNMFDQSGFMRGIVFLGEFVPYRRARN